MKYVDCADFEKNFEEYFDRAEVETIAITLNDEPRCVLVPYDIFKEFPWGRRQALKVWELTEADKKAIAEARMPEEYRYLDAELDDDEPEKP